MAFPGLKNLFMAGVALLVCSGGFLAPGVGPLAEVVSSQGDPTVQSGQRCPARVQIAALMVELTDEDDSFVSGSADPHGLLGAGPRCCDSRPRSIHVASRRLLGRAPKTSPPI